MLGPPCPPVLCKNQLCLVVVVVMMMVVVVMVVVVMVVVVVVPLCLRMMPPCP